MHAEFRDAFYGAVEAHAAAEGLPVSFPNKDYAPERSNNMYLRAFVLPTTPQVMGLCSGISEHIMLVQVSVYVREDAGDYRANEQASRIADSFPVARRFTTANHLFTVITPPSPLPPISVDGWFLTPVQFRIQTIV